MIDYSPKVIARVLDVFEDDYLEHILSKKEYEDYYDSDMTKTDIAIKWISRLIIPQPIKTSDGDVYKESLRQIITSNMSAGANIHLAGIDDIDDIDAWSVEYRKFLLILWDYMFHEPFVAADLSKYRERIDEGFVNRPWMPETWGSPEYKELT